MQQQSCVSETSFLTLINTFISNARLKLATKQKNKQMLSNTLSMKFF